MLPMLYHGCTDIGRRRKLNEDSLLIDAPLGLFVVADGMGGHAAGEVASAESLEAISSMFHNDSSLVERIAGSDAPPENDLSKLSRLLESSIQFACYHVHGIAEADISKEGMGTTISALVLAGKVGMTGQVGDSRVYYVRGGKAHQLTEDHTLVNWQLKEGLITPEQARRARNRNVITRAVGSRDYVQVDLQLFPVQQGDQFMLCSDGLHEYVELEEIPEVLSGGDPERASKRLVATANERGGKDNITSIVIHVL
jgi:protein phosphatase